MNFIQKCKRNGGFTLVELIVVIAILAILAGVAVPAYTGYIAKAEKAGDLQLVGAVNTAFAAACLENNINTTDVVKAEIGIHNTNKTITGVESIAVSQISLSAAPSAGRKYLSSADIAQVNAAFQRYYTNMDSKFEVIVRLVFDPDSHSFEGMTEEEYQVYKKENSTAYTYAGSEIYVSDEAVAILQGSTFGKEIGAESLLNEVAGLKNFIGTAEFGNEMLANEDYMRSLASYMGVEIAAGDNAETISEKIGAVVADKGYNENNVFFNGFVYYAAENTAKLNHSEITTFLTSGNISSNLGSTQEEKLAKASMAYGMYTAFVNSEYNTTGATSSTNDPMGAITTISGGGAHSEAFQKYMESAEGQADLDAYMSAMTVINDSASSGATIDVLNGGFDNQQLKDLMQSVIGK